MTRFALLALFLAAPALRAAEPPPSPADGVRAAHADARRLPVGAARYARYLYVGHIPEARRGRAVAALTLHANRLSVEPRLFQLREVCDCLYAIDLREMDSADPDRLVKVWETLAPFNVAFVIGVDVPADAGFDVVTETVVEDVKRTRKVPHLAPDGRQYYDPNTLQWMFRDEEYTEKVERKVEKRVPKAGGSAARKFIPAAGKTADGYDLWLPPGETAELVTLTGSVTPVVPGDFWHDRTAFGEDGRDDHSPYRWWGVKTRQDIEKLAGFDRDGAKKRRQELFAVQRFSKVAKENRQWFAFEDDGRWLESHDCAQSKDFFDPKKGRVVRQNAFANFFEDLEHVGEEHIFRLPNRLAGGSISNAAGVLLNSVPPNLANNTKSLDPDTRIQIYHCWECHERGGVKPSHCDLRAQTDPRTGLGLGALLANDPARRRLEYGATGPIFDVLDRAAAGYERAVTECCGLTPEQAIAATKEMWVNYAKRPVSLRQAAAETGRDPVAFHARLEEYAAWKAARGKGIEPVLGAWLIPNGPGVRREHFEDRLVLVMLIQMGANP